MDIERATTLFLDSQRYFKNATQTSLTSSRQEIRHFTRSVGIVKVSDISAHNLGDYIINGLRERNWKMTTVLTKRHTLNPFFDWCVQQGHLNSNPLELIPKPRVEYHLMPSLTRQQASHLLTVVYNCYHRTDFSRYRSYAMIATCIFAGVRRSELFQLKVEEVDFGRQAIIITQGKGRKDRIIPLNESLSTILKEYINQRKKIHPTVPELFCQNSGKAKYCGYAFKFIINRFVKISAIPFTLNTLRHTFATLLLESGADLHAISKMMGHANIETTRRYLNVCVEHLRGQIGKHPVSIEK
ncbi:tyrosine-type recombinase/integrase [Sediminibacterium ginsengisoli]|uniref:Integrase/recombinase XerD n=1 Tax=Sediminibacterium ginsengisoli TaxID=413434 RepID=A0A1T4NFV2_9BACT|nr:tyrosine-type recombinase/integrase [Sediminibacterium ginsengisoli]SJZ77877.1 integrase/recombinase XerD [Sediminibacterium ginsengisoli]